MVAAYASGPSAATTKPKSGSVKKPTYDPSQAATDWAALMQLRRQFDQDVILTVEQFYRQRDPDTPYLNIPAIVNGVAGNAAKQVTDPTLTFLVDKGIAYNLSGDLAVQCRADRNSASPRNLGYCEDLISFAFDINEMMAPAHFSQEIIHEMLMLFGWVPLEIAYADPDDAHRMLGGFPFKVTAHSPMTTTYEHEPDGSLYRVIVGKRMMVSELPDPWRTGSLASRADTDEVQVFQDFNRFTFTAVVENDIVDQYDHGYTMMGNPIVPFVIGLHRPMVTRLGDVPPQLSYSSPRELRVGRPPWMGLIGSLRLRSFFLTAQRYNIREFLTAWMKQIGDVDVDYDGKRAIVRTVGNGDFDFIEPANVLSDIQAGLQTTDEMIQNGGMSNAGLSGDHPKQASGVAVQAATDVVKQTLEAVRRTHEKTLSAAGRMILSMVETNTEASEPRQFKRATGVDLHPSVVQSLVQSRPADGVRQPPAKGQHPLAGDVLNSGALPFYWWVTGDVRVPLDNLTVAGVTRVDIGIQPYDSLPKEQRIQMFMNAKQSEAQTGKKMLPDDMLYGEILGVSNPQAVLARIATDELMGDPTNPLRRATALRNLATERMSADAANSPFWTNLLTQLDQREEQLLQQWAQRQMATLGQPPQPGGAPPQGMQPHPGGQPPPQPGQPPPQIPPGGPPILPAQGNGPVPGMGNPMPGGPSTMPQQMGPLQGAPPPGVM